MSDKKLRSVTQTRAAYGRITAAANDRYDGPKKHNYLEKPIMPARIDTGGNSSYRQGTNSGNRAEIGSRYDLACVLCAGGWGRHWVAMGCTRNRNCRPMMAEKCMNEAGYATNGLAGFS